MISKVDILALGAHPDDVELSCAGTLIKYVGEGRRVGICDFTKGELGTRGSAALRMEEAEAAREVIGATWRHNLGIEDGFFEVSEHNLRSLIEVIRAAQPEIVLCNAVADRHPDHGRGAELASRACFLSGLRRIDTIWNGDKQAAWRPRLVLHYIQDRFIQPDIVLDISDTWQGKLDAIKAFSSQFFDPNSEEPASPIALPEFLPFIEGRALQFGRMMGVKYGEGFNSESPLGTTDLFALK